MEHKWGLCINLHKIKDSMSSESCKDSSGNPPHAPSDRLVGEVHAYTLQSNYGARGLDRVAFSLKKKRKESQW